MKRNRNHRLAALLGILAVAACEDGTPTEPFADDLLTLEETVELQVLSNQASIDVALDLAQVNNNVADRRGSVRSQDGREFQARARVRFANAQDALRRGEHRQALDDSREARVLVVRAIEASGGGRAVSAMVERLEAMTFTLAEDTQSFSNPASVAAEISDLAVAARGALARGDTTGAGERVVPRSSACAAPQGPRRPS
jgi:hypothetical protein